MKYRSDKKGVPHFGLTLRDYQILWREVIFKRDAKYHNDLMITVISKNNITNKIDVFSTFKVSILTSSLSLVNFRCCHLPGKRT